MRTLAQLVPAILVFCLFSFNSPAQSGDTAVIDLVVTWRIWIRGPRATKYFWADAKGNLSDHQ